MWEHITGVNVLLERGAGQLSSDWAWSFHWCTYKGEGTNSFPWRCHLEAVRVIS